MITSTFDDSDDEPVRVTFEYVKGHSGGMFARP